MDGLFLLFIVILILCFVLIPIFVNKHKKNDSWTGILEDKKVIKYRHRGRYIIDNLLYFRKDTGETVKYNVHEEIFNSFEKGDKVTKIKDENYPVKQ